MHCYRSRIIDSHAATPAEADQKIQCTLVIARDDSRSSFTEQLQYQEFM